MTDNEIIKALEICVDETIEDGHCKNCPCQDACYGEEGIHALEKASLDLIQRQRKEIKSIKKDRKHCWEEFKRLLNTCESEKAEAVKEFADRIVEQLEEKTKEPMYQHNGEDYFVGITEAIEIVKGGAE